MPLLPPLFPPLSMPSSGSRIYDGEVKLTPLSPDPVIAAAELQVQKAEAAVAAHPYRRGGPTHLASAYRRSLSNARARLAELRAANMPRTNLLGLNKKESPNLLQFGPTKDGLSMREKELQGLFKGGSNKSSSKSKTRRRNIRKRSTRKNMVKNHCKRGGRR